MVGFCHLYLVTWNTSVSGFLKAECPVREEQGLTGLSERVDGLEGDFDMPPSLHGTLDHRLLSDLGYHKPNSKPLRWASQSGAKET